MARAVGKVLPAVLILTRWLMAGVSVYHTPWLTLTPQVSVGLFVGLAFKVLTEDVMPLVKTIALAQLVLVCAKAEGREQHAGDKGSRRPSVSSGPSAETRELEQKF